MCEGGGASSSGGEDNSEGFMEKKSITSSRFNKKMLLLQIRQHVSLALAIGQCRATHYGVCEGWRASRAVEEVDGECFLMEKSENNAHVSMRK